MTSLDKKIIDYLPLLSVKQKRAILGLMKEFTEQQETHAPWDDPAFVKEMDRRVAEMESGKAKMYSWEEVKDRIERRIK